VKALSLTKAEDAPRWHVILAAFGAGLVLALGHAPYNLPWGAIVAVPVLLRLLTVAPTPRIAALRGWMAGCGYFGLSLTWIVEPFLVDIARHGWMAPFAIVLLAGGLALFWGLGFFLAAIASRRAGLVGKALALALGLTLAEYLRSTMLTGFPWALFAYTFVETPLAQWAAYVGPHGLGGAMLLCLGLLGTARPLSVAMGGACLAALWVGGAARVPDAPSDTGPVLRLVQPNAPQHLKWQPEMLPVFYARLIDATAAPAEGSVNAVIWPETAVPFLLGERPDLAADIALAASGKTPVILGARRLDAQGNWFNSLAAYGADGAELARYDKHHLVPFGEYIPLTGVLEALGLSRLAEGLAGGFRPGTGAERLTLDGLPPFQPLICYEAIFPHEILRGAKRPDWLLHITNDAWFGTWSGPYQHLVQAQMRAIEHGLPLARAANTGVSAMIDPFGRITASLPLGEAGFVDATLPVGLPPTPYAQTPDWLVPLLAALALVAAGVRNRMIAGSERRW